MKHDIESALDTVDRTIVRYKRGYIYSSVHVRDHMTAELENKQQSKSAIRLSCNARSTKLKHHHKAVQIAWTHFKHGWIVFCCSIHQYPSYSQNKSMQYREPTLIRRVLFVVGVVLLIVVYWRFFAFVFLFFLYDPLLPATTITIPVVPHYHDKQMMTEKTRCPLETVHWLPVWPSSKMTSLLTRHCT